MPRPSTIRHPLLAKLVRELRLVSREAMLRDIERVEALAPDIDPETEYPLEWLIFRITGFRTQSTEPADQAVPATIRGDQVLANLCSISEQLCARAQLRENELDAGKFARPATLCQRWHISNSTFKRLRRRGLVCRLALNQRCVGVLVVRESISSWFGERHASLLSNQQGKARIPTSLRNRLVREALRYQRVLGLSPHAISQRLCVRHGPSPSPEAIRQLLARHPKTRAIFALKTHATMRRRLAMLRLHSLGCSANELATLACKRTPLVRRDLALARLHLLESWAREGLILAYPVAKQVPKLELAIAAQAANVGLREAIPIDLADIIEFWRRRAPMAPGEERALAWALVANRAIAWTGLQTIDRLHPSPVLLDQAETALRWASLLHRRLVLSQGRLVLDTIDVRTQSTCEQLPVQLLTRLLRSGLLALSNAALTLEPAKGGRLAGAGAFAIDRFVTRVLREANWRGGGGAAAGGGEPAAQAKRAQSILVRGIDSRALLANMVLWDRWLWPAQLRLERLADDDSGSRLEPDLVRILTRRFGLDQQAPWTLDQLRKDLDLTTITISQQASRAMRALRDAYKPA